MQDMALQLCELCVRDDLEEFYQRDPHGMLTIVCVLHTLETTNLLVSRAETI
jgi:hypothetical protein